MANRKEDCTKPKCQDNGKMQSCKSCLCAVCVAVDNDHTKKVCFYCKFCKAYICEPDLKALGRRAQAAIITKLNL